MKNITYSRKYEQNYWYFDTYLVKKKLSNVGKVNKKSGWNKSRAVGKAFFKN